jgi:hypothetical protein
VTEDARDSTQDVNGGESMNGEAAIVQEVAKRKATVFSSEFKRRHFHSEE